MGNSLIFTGLILLAGLAGGLIGSACGKRRNALDVEARIAELEERLDALATHCMDEGKRLKDRMGSNEDMVQRRWEWIGGVEARVSELEFLVGETPTGGLLGRVGALEDAELHRPSGPKLTELVSCVDAQADRIEEVRHELYEQIRDIVGTGEEVQIVRG